jgi:NADH-quinone oxidoreductase subunit C
MADAADTSPLAALAERVRNQLGESILDHGLAYGELTVVVARSAIVDVITFLHDHEGFISIVDIAGVDYLERDERFDVVYHLLSPKQNLRVRVKLTTDEDQPVLSLTGLFPGAVWYEREAYDLYGILFSGNPDLRRILTDYGFDGYPLRKDFPTTGYVEVRYDEQRKRVVYEPVKLAQEFRQFDYLSPWEGTDYVLPGDEKAKQ